MVIMGSIERKGMGPGVYALVTSTGETYELKSLPQDFRKTGLQVKIEGNIRDDVMSFAMIGPILEVVSIEAVS